MTSGIYFDGRAAAAHPVLLTIKNSAIHLLGQGIDLLIPIAQVRLNEPFMHAPGLLELGNGAHCEVQSKEDKDYLLKALGYQPSQVERWQARWVAALAAIVIMLGLLFSAYYWGIPYITATVAERIPTSVETKIGTEMLPVLDKTLFKTSRLSDIRMQQARDIFDNIKPEHSRLPMYLIFRDSPQLGANALALPGGVIVVTDQMVIALTKKSGDLVGDPAKQLTGIFAHEIGHVELKHALKSLLSNSAVTVVAASLFGDFSAMVTAIPVVLINSEFSRSMESDADSYAIQLLRQRAISPSYLADVFELLHKQSENNVMSKLPHWMRMATDFSASHPSDDERIKRFRDAAAKAPVTTPINQWKKINPWKGQTVPTSP